MAEGGRDVAAFISPSRWYGDVMRSRLRIDPEKMHVIPVGVEAGAAPSGAGPEPPTIGYLARMAESMGLPLLVEAYLKLKKTEKFKSLRLHLSGGKTADDAPYLDGLRRRLTDEGVAADVRFFDEFDPKSRRAFLERLSVLTVPTPGGVAFGTFVLEAGAAGVPVVEPRIGSYPELIEATGGGVLYEPKTADALARALGDLLGDEARRAQLGCNGRESVERSCSLATMAQKMTELYRSIVPAAKVGEVRRA
jgi:glycosyltransferase involved in cell wall biosynthesis